MSRSLYHARRRVRGSESGHGAARLRFTAMHIGNGRVPLRAAPTPTDIQIPSAPTLATITRMCNPRFCADMDDAHTDEYVQRPLSGMPRIPHQLVALDPTRRGCVRHSLYSEAGMVDTLSWYSPPEAPYPCDSLACDVPGVVGHGVGYRGVVGTPVRKQLSVHAGAQLHAFSHPWGCAGCGCMGGRFGTCGVLLPAYGSTVLNRACTMCARLQPWMWCGVHNPYREHKHMHTWLAAATHVVRLPLSCGYDVCEHPVRLRPRAVPHEIMSHDGVPTPP